MTIRNRTIAMTLGMIAVVLATSLPIVAQDPATAKQTTPAKKKQEVPRRVPDYFGQIGLTPDQKTNIYAIQAKHQEKIQALELAIANHKAELLNESEKVLTDVQKQLLADLRKAANEPAAKAVK